MLLSGSLTVSNLTANGNFDTGGFATQYVNTLNGSGSIINRVSGATTLCMVAAPSAASSAALTAALPT